jgi:hypothetical protein
MNKIPKISVLSILREYDIDYLYAFRKKFTGELHIFERIQDVCSKDDHSEYSVIFRDIITREMSVATWKSTSRFSHICESSDNPEFNLEDHCSICCGACSNPYSFPGGTLKKVLGCLDLNELAKKNYSKKDLLVLMPRINAEAIELAARYSQKGGI